MPRVPTLARSPPPLRQISSSTAPSMNTTAAPRARIAPCVCSLQDLQRVLAVTDALGALVEEQGVRSVAGLRTSLQQTCQAALAGMHADNVRRLTGEGPGSHVVASRGGMRPRAPCGSLERRNEAQGHMW